MQKKNYYLESVFDLNASNVWGVSAQELLPVYLRPPQAQRLRDRVPGP